MGAYRYILCFLIADVCLQVKAQRLVPWTGARIDLKMGGIRSRAKF